MSDRPTAEGMGEDAIVHLVMVQYAGGKAWSPFEAWAEHEYDKAVSYAKAQGGRVLSVPVRGGLVASLAPKDSTLRCGCTMGDRRICVIHCGGHAIPKPAKLVVE